MRKYINNSVSLMLLLFGLVSCEEHYLQYDSSYCGVYFTKDSTSYSFSVTPVEIKTYEYRIPIAIMGGLSKNTRTVEYEICIDKTTAENGVQYTIGDVCIMPDSITGYIPVIINREKLEGSYPDYTRYELCLKLMPNNNFVPTLDSLHQVHMFRFDNAIEQPEWYSKAGEKVWSVSKLGVWHPLKLIKMVEFFHALESVKPETYKKIVAAYGENLEHIPYGDPELYKATFDKYIYKPMYDYFSAPENEEYIRSEFPDFPFDFPNPYGENK
ncbi:MAG: DUF4843 domain-containing protein [Bacteroidaceae bacterium]|nr:DUF4843 domain-containing protein [Bacteroidaceae bacterium]